MIYHDMSCHAMGGGLESRRNTTLVRTWDGTCSRHGALALLSLQAPFYLALPPVNMGEIQQRQAM